jgi:hypothetical protein
VVVDSTGEGGAIRLMSSGITKCRGLRQKVIFTAVLMVYGLVMFSFAHYMNIDLMIPQGTIVMQGFVNSKENDVTKIMEVRELESVESVLKMEERSESSQAALQY